VGSDVNGQCTDYFEVQYKYTVIHNNIQLYRISTCCVMMRLCSLTNM
jgi:hypothetical protein